MNNNNKPIHRLTLPCLIVATTTLFNLPATAAEVDVYGQVHAAYSHYNSKRGAHGTTLDDPRNGSRIGVVAAEPVNGSVTGLARFELGFNPTEFNADPVHGREAWVGLRGGMGQLSIGRFAGVYGTTGGMSWDVMADTVLEQRRNGGMSGGAFGHGGVSMDDDEKVESDGHISRLVEYRLPALGGLQVTVQAGADDRGTGGADGNDLLFGARYREDSWELIGAYAKNGDNPDGENHNWKLGARYTVGAGSIAYQYEKVRIGDRIEDGTVTRIDGDLALDSVAVNGDARHHFVGISQQLPGAVFWLAWGYLDADNDDLDLQSYTAALSRGFGDGFRWYFGLQHQDRGQGYESGDLLVSSTGLQFSF